MKRAALAVVAVLLILSALPSETQGQAASPTPSTKLLPPVSIELTAVPRQLPPGGLGILIIQLVDANGNPSPARNGSVSVDLYSSDPDVVTVQNQATIPYAKSHAEAQMQAGIRGNATITAIANGFLSGSAEVSSSEFSEFALKLVPLNNPVLPGDSLELRVALLAAGRPFVTPATVQALITTSIPAIAEQSVQIRPGSSYAYANLSVPKEVNLTSTPFMTVAVTADGFASATSFVAFSQKGTDPQEVIVGPAKTNLTSGGKQFLSVSLLSDAFLPTSGSITLGLSTSNSSVVDLLSPEATISGADSAAFPVYANATGTAQITAVAPGLTPIPLTVTVVKPAIPSLQVSLPAEVRARESYGFSVGFFYGGEPIPFGPTTVYLSSSNSGIAVPASLQVSALGYSLGIFSTSGEGAANVTAVLQGAKAATANTVSLFVPVVAPVTYAVKVLSDAGPLLGVPVNFTYAGRHSVVATGPSGTAFFTTYNDTATLADVPTSVTLNNKTFFFTGWSTGLESENTSLLASTPAYSMTAQYFRSVVPTTYSLLAVSDGREPVPGLRLNVTSGKLAKTLTTNSDGMASFVLPNGTSFEVTLPETFQQSGETRYDFVSANNSTRNALNVTSSSPMTIDAAYATYYQFQVNSPLGGATGSGWYKSGSTISYSVDQTSAGGPLVFQRFAGWAGSFASGQPNGSVIIDSPASITAQWTTDNSLLFAAAAGVLAAAAVIGFFVFRLRKKAPPS